MKRIGIVLLAAAVISAVCACGASSKGGNTTDMKDPHIDLPSDEELDVGKVNEAADSIKNLELNTDVNVDMPDDMTPPSPEDEDIEKYSYTDVKKNGDEITVIPNGGLNGSTVLYADKDLNGFLDYVDSEVLEEGRDINRDFFYDLLAIMLVDEKLSPDFEKNEKNIMMALAVANNFYDADVKINKCTLDANNASEYHYDVTAYGTDDTWIVDYGKRTIYLNNGATEYTSTMFDNENLAVWMVAIENYYM